MTFTYLGTLATDLDKVRFYLGDTSSVSGAGVKPGGGNFTDEELSGLLAVEGSVGRAVAGGFETLAGLFARQVDFTLGPRREALSQAAERYGKLADSWRKKYGSGGSAARVGSRHVTRVDGYSQDIASDSP
jgi:hypothetical protein